MTRPSENGYKVHLWHRHGDQTDIESSVLSWSAGDTESRHYVPLPVYHLTRAARTIEVTRPS